MKEKITFWCELYEKMIKGATDRENKQRLFNQCFGGVQFACVLNEEEYDLYADLWAEWKYRLEELVYDV